MKKNLLLAAMALLIVLAAASAPQRALAADPQDCWGQATAVFSQLGLMGEHASEEETPRVGLRNLARLLYADGTIPDDTMQALGVFVATEYGLSVEACAE